MAIIYFTENVKLPVDFKRRLVSQWIKEIASNYKMKIGNIAYSFCSDEKIIEVNKQYLQHDYYTDIITFDYTEGNTLSGDLYISLDTVQSNSEQFNTNYLEELYRVIIHGILHLCGINDQTEEEQEIMTIEENKALDILRTKIELINR